MVNQFRNVPLHLRFDLVVVLNQGNNKIIAHMQQFQSQRFFRDLLAVEDKV